MSEPIDALFVRDHGATTVQQFIASIPHREFPSRFAEDAFRSEAERLVRNEGSRYEAKLVKQGEQRHAAMQELGAASDELVSAMRDLQKRHRAGEIATVAAYDEFERLHAIGARIIQKASIQPGAVGQLLEQLDDPIAALAYLQSKYSTLRRVYP